MNDTSKIKLIRKILRRDKTFFSGSIKTLLVRFDYQIYGISYSYSPHYRCDMFKLNVRVTNLESYYYITNMRNINRQIRDEIRFEWRDFFMSMFNISRWDLMVGLVKHINLNKL